MPGDVVTTRLTKWKARQRCMWMGTEYVSPSIGADETSGVGGLGAHSCQTDLQSGRVQTMCPSMARLSIALWLPPGELSCQPDQLLAKFL